MKVSLNWIREYTPVELSPKDYQDKMVMHGLGVETVTDLSQGLEGVVVGRVLTCVPHPNSDHLHLCQVDVGQEQPLKVVCGAPNVAEGQLVPAALIGARLPDGTVIRQGKIRGEESFGMLCSATELAIPQELYPSVGEKGLLVLQGEHLPGTDIREVFFVKDTVVDFDILANRPDCLSVLGVARETAAILNQPFLKPDIKVQELGGDIHTLAKVTVQDSEHCPRYAARVITKVKIGPSPLWLKARLHAAGIRSINNIVDITNYVMLETGHPMHAFDLKQVSGRHIIVRQAQEGERLTTLDNKVHDLKGGELLICDEAGPTGLAGIMGGLDSEITQNTSEILFECAAFDRALTRSVSRRLGIRTESGGRFERGVNPATVLDALNRACELVVLFQAGEVVSGVIDHYPAPVKPVELTASVSRIAKRAGTDISGEEMVSLLQRLGFEVSLAGDSLQVRVPILRQDISQEADLCEEVLRLAGYDRIPETLLRGETTPGRDSDAGILTQKMQGILSGLGFYEIFNYSFTGQKQIAMLGLQEEDPRLSALSILNPLGEDSAIMRTTLVPDMLRVLSHNMNQKTEEGLLYEFGTLYDKNKPTQEGLFTESRALCLGSYGKGLDFYFLRDAVLTLLVRFGIRYEIKRGKEVYYHPGRQAEIFVGKERIAVVGQVHPLVGQRFDLHQDACVAEINLPLFTARMKAFDAVKPLPRTPAVKRDLALVLDQDQDLMPVQNAIQRAAGKLLTQVELFDVFRGKQLGEGKKSAAFSLTLQNPEKTLEETEIKAVMERVIGSLKKQFKAEIRS